MSAEVMVAMIGVSVGLCGAAGGAIKFVWDKIEARFKRIENDLAKCEQREHTAVLRSARKLTCIELLWGEVARLAPGDTGTNPVLLRVGRIIEELSRSSPLNHPVEDFVNSAKGSER